MGLTVLRQIVRFVAAPPGPTILPHNIQLDSIAQIPDLVIGVTGTPGAIDIPLVTATEITLQNNGAGAVDVDVWCYLDHTIDRAYFGFGPPTGMVPRPFIVIAQAGGGAPGGGTQRFLYTATGLETTDFMVALPAARPTDTYVVDAWLDGVLEGTQMYSFCMPNQLPADRTVATFRVNTSFAPSLGDRIIFEASDLT